MVEETPNAVAIPISTGKEIRPLAGISATIDISAPYGQASSAGGFGRPRHSSPAGRHSSQQDGPEPKVIAAFEAFRKDASREADVPANGILAMLLTAAVAHG